MSVVNSNDLALSADVPADKVLDLIPECRAKGIKNMLLVTSGFSETGAEGIALEKKSSARWAV